LARSARLTLGLAAAALIALAPAVTRAGLWKPKEASPSTKSKAPGKAKPPAAAKTKSATLKAKPGRAQEGSADRSERGRGGPKRAKRATSPDPKVVVAPGAKVAVMAFSGDDAEAVRRQVLRVLRSKGMKVNAGLRPVDSAEQYREMATALGLVAYVHGEVSGDGDEESATIHVRGGHSGLRIASSTFSGARRELPGNVGRELWTQMGGAFARACNDASKPRKSERGPMRINAGTPIADTPVD
jgi:hypothetical protein